MKKKIVCAMAVALPFISMAQKALPVYKDKNERNSAFGKWRFLPDDQ